MWFPFLSRHRPAKNSPTPSRRQSTPVRLTVEALEDRSVPAFLPPVTSPIGFVSYAVGDFNNDGRADLLTYDYTIGTAVRLSNGNGSFQAPLLMPGGPNLKVGDVNADGNLDVVFLGYKSSAGSIEVLLGKGDGTFRSGRSTMLPKVRLQEQSLSGFELGDLNNDGRLDIVATGWTIGRYPYGGYYYRVYLNVLMGQGGGSFKADPNPTFVGESIFTKLHPLQDFDGDRKLDALLSNGRADGSFLFLGRGDGSFKTPIPTIAVVTTDLLTDVNGDGKADLVSTQSPLVNTVRVSLGNGDGTFQSPGFYSVDGTPGRVVGGDFNGDGKLDLVTVSRTSGTISVLLGNGDGIFQSVKSFAAGSSPSALAVGDFNGDGWPDLVVGDYDPLSNSYYSLSVLLNDRSW